ncbi:MAG: hypothetical protein LUG21_04000 [Clostridiales bacterium]|nr:hypothetical protein [Clostridiales bacterium]
MNFKNFLGNEKTKSRISSLFDSSKLPHALVIEGEQGMGKRTLAREIAAALVCRSDFEKPCYECVQCNKAVKKIHPDIFEYSAEGGAKSFHVDVIRNVINDVYVYPNEADYKIYILGNAHCMSESAQNAILKILEEPPSYAVFILTAENKSMLLETVLSRSVTISVSGVLPEIGAEFICGENPDIDFQSAYNAMIALNGNIGKARENLKGGRLRKITELACKIGSAIYADNEYELIKAVSELSGSRQDMIAVLNMLKIVFRDAIAGNEILSGMEELVNTLSNKYTKSKLMALYNTLLKLDDDAGKNANAALLVTKICYSLREAAGR